jgi:hypothetical protein
MVARWREGKRGVGIVLAAGLAAAALAAVLAAGATARPLDFLHLHSNLSQTAVLISAYPDLAVSPDGDRVVAAWTEGYRDGVGYKGHVYLRAASGVGVSWGSKVPVFSGGGSTCAYDVAVAVTDTTAHVAYVVFNNTCSDPTHMQVRYRACSLASLDSGQCDGSEDMVASADTLFNSITWVDLAVDASGNPHVVWAQYDENNENGDVYYRASDGTNWGSPEGVALSGDNNTPAIAWADGYVHVVWEEEAEHVIKYRRRSASGWEPPEPLCSPQTVYRPGNPDVAAEADRVFVVWDWCSDLDSTLTCWKYHLVYLRSNDRGAGWGDDIREVGTDSPDFAEEYDSVDDPHERDDYLLRLRPAISLNEDGWPAVVWHAKRNGGGGEEGGGGGESYAICYSYAISGTDSTVDWITTTVLNEEQPNWLASAAVAVGARDGEQRLHAAYMRKPSKDSPDAWDVYYEGFSYNPQARIHVARGGLALVSSTVTLDGSGSYDPLGFPLTYDWSLTGKPAGSVAALSAPSAVSPTITVDVIGYYTVTLEVDNGLMASLLATQTILACETIYDVYLPLVLRGGL